MTNSEGVATPDRIETATRLDRDQHGITVELVDAAAMNVITGLRDAGFEALLVGGCVRDMLLGIAPKDFDVATDATPEQVSQVFRRTRLIGRRFRIAHVRFGREVIEVSTFRRQLDDEGEPAVNNRRELRGKDTALSAEGVILRDNAWGRIDEDAFRRDFTVNALYYDPMEEVLIDYLGGVNDLRHRRLKLIGKPAIRYREDPIRIIRAIRFAAKLDFELDGATGTAIPETSHMLNEVAPARLFDELCKLFLQGSAEQAWLLVRDLDLAETLFPDVELTDHVDELIVSAMRGTDERIRDGKPVTPGFLFAVLLWDTYLDRLLRHTEFSSLVEARDSASVEVLREQGEISSIPRRFSQFIREVWLMQPRLEAREPKTLGRVLSHPRFRAAYDFLLLRAATGEVDQSLADWWTEYQELEGGEQATMRSALDPGKSRRRRRRRRRRSGDRPQTQDVDGNKLDSASS